MNARFPVRGLTVIAGAGLLLLAATCWRCAQVSAVVAVRAPDHMGARAFNHVAKLVSFGERHTGSPGSKKGLEYVEDQLKAMGLTPVRDTWKNDKENITFHNITVLLPGESPNLIVIGCHHDTKNCHTDKEHDFHFVGANDSGSGVGLLLELARALESRRRRATYELVFFDGEESLSWSWDIKRALFGSKRYVRRYQQRLLNDADAPVIKAFVLLDMVGARDLQIDDETNSDQELRDLFYAAAKATGHERYFYKHRLPITDDHIPFIEAKIRCIDLIDLDENDQWHTRDDTLAHISADSLHLVGEVVLTALPEIEARYFPRPQDSEKK